MLLLAKQFLWKQKFGSRNINDLQFIIFMKQELTFLQNTMDFKGEKFNFCTEWNEILQHFEVD